MSVTITLPPKRIRSLKSGSIVADGTLQVVLEYTGVGRVMGYIDLRNMAAGDETVIGQHMKLKADGLYEKYNEKKYVGPQAAPIIYITPKESDFGMKVTLQQVSGTFKTYDFNFMQEE